GGVHGCGGGDAGGVEDRPGGGGGAEVAGDHLDGEGARRNRLVGTGVAAHLPRVGHLGRRERRQESKQQRQPESHELSSFAPHFLQKAASSSLGVWQPAQARGVVAGTVAASRLASSCSMTASYSRSCPSSRRRRISTARAR